MKSQHATLLAPSLLAGHHGKLLESARHVEECGLEWLHLDIMDGHFVPNLTFGPQTLADIREHTRLFFDTHLMLSNPHEHIEAFAHAGADQISIHVEPDYPIKETLDHIGECGCKKGIVMNPSTPAESVRDYLECVDIVLVMTVYPGFGGQSFIYDTLQKMKQLHHWREGEKYTYRLEVDGGVNEQTAQECKNCGVDTLVAGSAFYKAPNKHEFIHSVVV